MTLARWARRTARVRALAGTSCLGAAIVDGLETQFAERLRVARALDDATAEVHGRPPWTPHFCGPGELEFIEIWEAVNTQGSIDKARAEATFERYWRRADESSERMFWICQRAGLDVSDEEKRRSPGEGAYANLDEGREFLWGRVRHG